MAAGFMSFPEYCFEAAYGPQALHNLIARGVQIPYVAPPQVTGIQTWKRNRLNQRPRLWPTKL
jgi:hypothetical protein